MIAFFYIFESVSSYLYCVKITKQYNVNELTCYEYGEYCEYTLDSQ